MRAGKQRTRSHSQGRLVQTWTQRTKVDTEESRALAEWPWDTRCREQGSVRCAGAGRGSGGSWLLEVSVVPRAAMRGQDMGTEKTGRLEDRRTGRQEDRKTGGQEDRRTGGQEDKIGRAHV